MACINLVHSPAVKMYFLILLVNRNASKQQMAILIIAFKVWTGFYKPM